MSVLQYTSGKMWIVATYRKEPADTSKRMPTQNISLFEFTEAPVSIMIRRKYAVTVAIGAAKVKL